MRCLWPLNHQHISSEASSAIELPASIVGMASPAIEPSTLIGKWSLWTLDCQHQLRSRVIGHQTTITSWRKGVTSHRTVNTGRWCGVSGHQTVSTYRQSNISSNWTGDLATKWRRGSHCVFLEIFYQIFKGKIFYNFL